MRTKQDQIIDRLLTYPNCESFRKFEKEMLEKTEQEQKLSMFNRIQKRPGNKKKKRLRGKRTTKPLFTQ